MGSGILWLPLYTIDKRGASGECLNTFELEEDEKPLRKKRIDFCPLV